MENSKTNNFAIKLVDDYGQGNVTTGEFVDKLYGFCFKNPQEKDFLFNKLLAYKDESIKSIVQAVKDIFLKAEQQVKNINRIREISPLQPKVTILLYGGYDHGNHWWLNGRKYYKATFINFFYCGVDKMPVAFVELQEEIDIAEGCGLHHKGRYALLKLHFVANWDETEIVEIHVVESLPDDIEAFYKSHPFGTEIETHASYKVIDNNTI